METRLFIEGSAIVHIAWRDETGWSRYRWIPVCGPDWRPASWRAGRPKVRADLHFSTCLVCTRLTWDL